jgi:hypothetical protein
VLKLGLFDYCFVDLCRLKHQADFLLLPSSPAEQANTCRDKTGHPSTHGRAGHRTRPMFSGDISPQSYYVIGLFAQAVDNKINSRSGTEMKAVDFEWIVPCCRLMREPKHLDDQRRAGFDS